MRRFSLERSDNAPNPAIHGASLGLAAVTGGAAPQLLVERLGEELLQGDAAAGSHDLCPPERSVGQLDCRLHMGIFPYLWVRVNGARRVRSSLPRKTGVASFVPMMPHSSPRSRCSRSWSTPDRISRVNGSVFGAGSSDRSRKEQS